MLKSLFRILWVKYLFQIRYNSLNHQLASIAALKMKNTNKIIILLLVVVLGACSSGGGSSSSDARSLNTIEQQTRNFYFYRNDGAIKAIDYDNPTSPITIEPASSNFTAYTANEFLIPVDGNPDQVYAAKSSLVYVKDGKFWLVDQNANANLAPKQISNINSVSRVCWSDLYAGAGSTSILRYTLANFSNECFIDNYYAQTLNNGVRIPGITNMVYQWLSMNMNAISPPNPDAGSQGWYGGDSILFYDSTEQVKRSSIRGVLALDDSGNLLWYEGTDFSAPTHTVATNVTSLQSINFEAGSWQYIIVDGSVYGYSPGDLSLGSSLYQMSLISFQWIILSELSKDYFFAVDGQRLMKFSAVTPGAPDIIAEDPLIGTMWPMVKETNTHLYIQSTFQNIIDYGLSVDISTGDIAELLYVTRGPAGTPGIRSIFSNNKIYYTDNYSNNTYIVSMTGDVLNTFTNSSMSGYIYSPVIDSGNNTLTHLLLDQPIDATNSAMVILSLDTDTITRQLAIAETGSIGTNDMVRQYQGKIVFSRNYYDGPNSSDRFELYYADLNQDNSLIQLTSDTAEDVPIKPDWFDPGPFILSP